MEGCRVAEELYVHKIVSGHLFYKYCGRNYLGKVHNEGCLSLRHDELTIRTKPPDSGEYDD